MGLQFDPSILVILVGDRLIGNPENLKSVSVDNAAASQADVGATIPRSKSSLNNQTLTIAAGKALKMFSVPATALPKTMLRFNNVLRSDGEVCE